MDDDNFIKIFKDEALELLGQLEDSLLELEENPTDEETISAVFRVMHTVKGASGMVGLSKISSFTHEVETLLESVRSGERHVTKGFIDYTLKSRDIILNMINDPDYEFLDKDSFIKEFKDAIDRKEDSESNIPEKTKDLVTYRVYFKPEPKMFFTGTNPLMMVHEVLDLGEGIVIPYYDAIPPLSEVETEECYTYWEIFVTTSESINKIHDVFIFLDEESTIEVEEWDKSGEDSIPEKLGDLLVRSGRISSTDLDKALKEQYRLGEILVKDNIVSESELKGTLKAQDFINKSKTKKVETSAPVSDSIRINSGKLDGLIDLVGEIVTIYAQMLQLSHESNDSKLISIIERFGLLTEELRDNSMSMRMLPIGSTFSRFRRLVRDLSGELGKKIDLVTEGAETELDKNVIEQLNDPLVHIIRNCIDHGIENPEVRKSANKKETGTIKLSAIHQGASVQIVIEDDGGGLSRDKIREKAVARGWLGVDEEIDDDDLFAFIFRPGFSTAAAVTNISGRGVGLDVVKKQIEELKGNVAITSKEGFYTRIILTLPITLAIIEGLLVKIAGDSYVVPLSSVEACVELKDADKDIQSGKNVIKFREKLVPYIDMRTLYGVTEDRPKIEQIVIVNTHTTQIGILVDYVVGGNQTVIKSLGSMYRNVKEISGASILGDGKVALVFDIEQLLRVVEETEEVSIGV